MKHSALIIVFFLFIPPISAIETKDTTPVISDLRVDPASGPTGTTYTLSLQIIDPQGPENVVQTLYQMREGLEAIELPINDEGLAGDLQKGDGIYTGKSRVPPTAAKESHRFEVFVRDKDRHKSNVLSYRFTVLEGLRT